MISTILLESHLVVDPLVWQIPLFILSVICGLVFVYYLYIGITSNMAKKRHRDPLGWVLLSFVISPIWVWIILLIAGDKNN